MAGITWGPANEGVRTLPVVWAEKKLPIGHIPPIPPLARTWKIHWRIPSPKTRLSRIPTKSLIHLMSIWSICCGSCENSSQLSVPRLSCARRPKGPKDKNQNSIPSIRWKRRFQKLGFFGFHQTSMCCFFAAWNDSQVLSLVCLRLSNNF